MEHGAYNHNFYKMLQVALVTLLFISQVQKYYLKKRQKILNYKSICTLTDHFDRDRNIITHHFGFAEKKYQMQPRFSCTNKQPTMKRRGGRSKENLSVFFFVQTATRNYLKFESCCYCLVFSPEILLCFFQWIIYFLHCF